MSYEKGFKAIIDEAEWQLQYKPDLLSSFIENLSAQSNHYCRAMLTYLDHKEYWRDATRFYHADSLPYWRKRKNMGHQPAMVDDASIQKLANLIRHYFHHTEGRGNNCVVEPLRRGELDNFASDDDRSGRQRDFAPDLPHRFPVGVFDRRRDEQIADVGFAELLFSWLSIR